MTWFHTLFARVTLGPARLVSDESGQALIEYALIVSLVALISIVALRTTGTNLSGVLNRIAGEA